MQANRCKDGESEFCCSFLHPTINLIPFFRDFRHLAKYLLRGVFFFGSFHRIKCIGKQAPASEAPIVVVAPHSSFFDTMVAVVTGPPSVVAKAETASLPFFGSKSLFNYPFIHLITDFPTRTHRLYATDLRVPRGSQFAVHYDPGDQRACNFQGRLATVVNLSRGNLH